MMSSAARSACLVTSPSEMSASLRPRASFTSPFGLTLGLGEHLLALLDDPASLLDLLRDRGAHLVEDVVDLLLVDAYLVRERNRLGVVNEIVQLVDEYQDVHREPLFRQRRGSSCKCSTTNRASSG